jgi:hypothetical protein
MEASPVVAFPRRAGDDDELVGAAALREIDAAIALILAGVARRVRLAGVPFADAVAGIGLAHARDAGLAFRLERADRVGVATVTVGPSEPRLGR